MEGDCPAVRVYGHFLSHKIACQVLESIPLTTLIHTDENLQCLLRINYLADKRKEMVHESFHTDT